MPDRTLKQEKTTISSATAAELSQAWERSDMYLPVATEVSPVPDTSRVVVYNDPRSAGADRFRWVGIRLKNLQTARGLKTLLITSPLPGDGEIHRLLESRHRAVRKRKAVRPPGGSRHVSPLPRQ